MIVKTGVNTLARVEKSWTPVRYAKVATEVVAKEASKAFPTISATSETTTETTMFELAGAERRTFPAITQA